MNFSYCMSFWDYSFLKSIKWECLSKQLLASKQTWKYLSADWILLKTGFTLTYRNIEKNKLTQLLSCGSALILVAAEPWKSHWLGSETLCGELCMKLYVANMRKDVSHSNMGRTLATALTVPDKFFGIYFTSLNQPILFVFKLSVLRC